MLIVQMDAEEGSDKICENLREEKSIPADHAADSRKDICENLREEKYSRRSRRWAQKCDPNDIE